MPPWAQPCTQRSLCSSPLLRDPEHARRDANLVQLLLAESYSIATRTAWTTDVLCFLPIKTPMPLKLWDMVCWEVLAGAHLDVVLEPFLIERTRSPLPLGYQRLQRCM